MVDLLDKKTKISGAFIGGVLLAAVTSLPELFTAISSVLIVKDPSLVIGDILGSDIFNLMILAVYSLMFFKNFRKCKINKFHIISLIVLIFFYACTAYAIFAPKEYQPMLGDINALSIVIFIVYVITIIKQPKEQDNDEISQEKHESKLSLKVVIILFIVLAVVLVGLSIGISLVTELIIKEIPALSGSVGGAVLLGICTSLPEVISTFHLFKLKNFNAGYGNMIGSCTFNFSILAVADFISWKATCGVDQISERGIFWNDASAQWMTIFGAIVILSIGIITCLKCFTKFFDGKKRGLILTIFVALIALGSYICSLVFKFPL